jgi:hypothetical protein
VPNNLRSGPKRAGQGWTIILYNFELKNTRKLDCEEVGSWTVKRQLGPLSVTF